MDSDEILEDSTIQNTPNIQLGMYLVNLPKATKTFGIILKKALLGIRSV
jgi:hypothetical protein